jgi:hypothetical protein
MPDLTSVFKTDLVDDHVAADINQVIAASLRANHANAETISANRQLADIDMPIQRFTATGGNRDVTLPAVGVNNHPFLISNVGASNRLTIKSGSSTLGAANPGQSLLFLPDGAAWRKFGDNYERDFITGLKLEWLAVNQVRVTPGAAYIEGTNEILRVTSAITVTQSINSMRHLYLYNNNGAAAIEVSSTAPAAPYFGTARSKTGDNTRRYIGSLAAQNISGTNTILNFLMVGNQIMYRMDSLTILRVVDSQSPTSETTVSCSTLVPPTAKAAILRIANGANTGIICTGTSDDSVAAPGTRGITVTGPNATTVVAHPLNSSQEFTYWYNVAPTGPTFVFIDLYGYIFER